MTNSLARRVVGLALVGAAAAAALTGCGGSSKPASASSDTPNGNGVQAYVACLGQHGVTLPSQAPGAARPTGVRPSGAPRPSRSPGAGGGFGGGGFGGGFGGGGFGGGIFGNPSNPPPGVDAAAWTAALAACKSLQPTFAARGGGGVNNSAFIAYRNCLSDHGVTASQGPGGFNTADPKVAAAIKTCAPLRPTGRPSIAPSPGPTG